MSMFEHDITPRFNETDALGHISNTVMPNWFEIARMPIFKIVHPPMSVEDWPIIVARVEIDFIRQVHLGNDVTIKTGVEKVGTNSLTVYQEAWQEGKIAASGRTVLVYFDYRKNSTVAIPDDIKEQLEELQQKCFSSGCRY